MFWFSLQLLSEALLILRRTERDMIIIMYNGLRVKYPLFLSDFNENLIFSTNFRKIRIPFHENPSSRSRVVPCWWTDGKTDMTKLLAAFRNFANAPKHYIYIYIYIYIYDQEDYQSIHRFNRLNSTYRLLFVIVPGWVLCETWPVVCV
jgi:hypothetical protein